MRDFKRELLSRFSALASSTVFFLDKDYSTECFDFVDFLPLLVFAPVEEIGNREIGNREIGNQKSRKLLIKATVHNVMSLLIFLAIASFCSCRGNRENGEMSGLLQKKGEC